jgi:phage shock protein PspC (stress-responsive transcriptional regulator)
MKGTAMSTSETQSASIKELHRSRDERILAGVAGGLGRYFDITPTFFRIGFAILALVGGAGILLYVAAWLVIPDEGESDSIVSEALRRRRDRPWLLAGVALVAIALVSLLAQADFWPNSGFAWTLLLLGGLAIMIAQRRAGDGTPPDVSTAPDDSTAPGAIATPAARPRQPSLLLPGLGVLLAAAGALALLDAVGVDVRWDVALAVGAIGTGVAVVAGVALRRRTGGLVVVGLVLASLAVAVSAVDVRLEGPIGSRVYSPVETSDLKRDYDISIGDLELDLSNAALAAGDTEVDANVGIGELMVIVPDGVAVDVDASASAGEVTVFGRSESGVDADLSASIHAPRSDRTLRIDAHVGLGDVIVERETP